MYTLYLNVVSKKAELLKLVKELSVVKDDLTSEVCIYSGTSLFWTPWDRSECPN